MLQPRVRAGARSPFRDSGRGGTLERQSIWIQHLGAIPDPALLQVGVVQRTSHTMTYDRWRRSSLGRNIDIAWPEMPVTVENPEIKTCTCSPRKRLVSFQGQARFLAVRLLVHPLFVIPATLPYPTLCVRECLGKYGCRPCRSLFVVSGRGAQTRQVRQKLRALHDGSEIVLLSGDSDVSLFFSEPPVDSSAAIPNKVVNVVDVSKPACMDTDGGSLALIRMC